MKKWNKVIALLLIAVLIVCGLAVSPSSKTSLAMTLKDEECSISEATTSGTAVSMEPTVKGLIRLIEANRLGNIDMNSYGEVQIEAIEKNMDPQEIYGMEAQHFQAKNGGKSVRYQIWDMDGNKVPEMFITYPAGNRMGVAVYGLNTEDYTLIRLMDFAGVNEVRKDTKKHQIVTMASSGANNVVYTWYKNTGKKLKKVVAYKKKIRVYKKNRKTITRDKFLKQVKWIKKLPVLKTKKIPKTQYESMTTAGEAYWSKDLYVYKGFYSSDSRDYLATILQKDGSNTQDNYLAYSFTSGKGKQDESKISKITRLVFGPDISAGDGQTYRQKDWEQLRLEKFGREYAPIPFYSETDGGTVSAPFDEDGINNFKAADSEAKNGSVTYSAKEYEAEIGGMDIVYRFFSEGAYAGRIAEIVVRKPGAKDDIPASKYIFRYGEEGIENRPEWDPSIGVEVRGQGVETGLPGSKNRTLTYKATVNREESTHSIVTDSRVRLELFLSNSGEFVSFLSDGSEYKTPVTLPAIAGGKLTVDLSDSWLNPSANKTEASFGDASYPQGLFWDPVTSTELLPFLGKNVMDVQDVFPYMTSDEIEGEEGITYSAYTATGEYATDNQTLAGPFFTLNTETLGVEEIEYRGTIHTLAGIRAGMLMSDAAEKLHADGWTFKQVEYAKNSAIPSLIYEKDGTELTISKSTEADVKKKTEADNIKDGFVFSVCVKKHEATT